MLFALSMAMSVGGSARMLGSSSTSPAGHAACAPEPSDQSARPRNPACTQRFGWLITIVLMRLPLPCGPLPYCPRGSMTLGARRRPAPYLFSGIPGGPGRLGLRTFSPAAQDEQRAPPYANLVVNVLQVLLDGVLGDAELARDLLVRHSLPHEDHDLLLARRELVERRIAVGRVSGVLIARIALPQELGERGREPGPRDPDLALAHARNRAHAFVDAAVE